MMYPNDTKADTHTPKKENTQLLKLKKKIIGFCKPPEKIYIEIEFYKTIRHIFGFLLNFSKQQSSVHNQARMVHHPIIPNWFGYSKNFWHKNQNLKPKSGCEFKQI